MTRSAVPPPAELTVYRAKPSQQIGRTVHVLRDRLDFALAAHCGNLLAAILADQATVPATRLQTPSSTTLEARGYCRHCLDAIRAAA